MELRRLRQGLMAPGAAGRSMVRHNRQTLPVIITVAVNGRPGGGYQYMPDSTTKTNCPVRRNIRPRRVPVADLVRALHGAGARLPFPVRIGFVFLLAVSLISEARFACAKV